MTRAPVNPEIVAWALERSGRPLEDAPKNLGKLQEWISGKVRPTVKQAERFARWVYVPFGYLFLSEPPEETLPIPDFRTLSGRGVRRPSPNLLDMIHVCQNRQDWYRDYLGETKEAELDFVGSAELSSPHEIVAARMRETLGFEISERRAYKDMEEALRTLIHHIEEAGILVMVSGIVMSNTHRTLDVEEFRGFALPDPCAPLIFVNGADAKAAQMFTLAHELAHIWLGASALSNLEARSYDVDQPVEVWCNAVAAEFLVPMDALKSELQQDEPLGPALSRLQRIYKVSALVILRRLLDAGWLNRNEFEKAWREEIMKHRRTQVFSGSGGDFYNTTLGRVGHRFVRALVSSTYEGRTLYRDAFHMLGISKTDTLNQLGRKAEYAQ